MVYGDEKKREMARSILPSKNARSAKSNLRVAHRKHRCRERDLLRRMTVDPDVYDDGDDFYDMKERVQVRRAVRDRQDGDKLKHFMQWAVKVTDGLEPDARMAMMKKVLPDNLVGWHARSHLENLSEFITDRTSWGATSGNYGNHPFQHRFKKEEVDLVGGLRRILADKDAWNALHGVMVANHNTNYWVMSYGAPRIEIAGERVIPPKYRYTKSRKHNRPYFRATVTMTPVVLNRMEVGPRCPPILPTREEDIRAYIEEVSAPEPKSVDSGEWEHQVKTKATCKTGTGWGDYPTEEAATRAALLNAQRGTETAYRFGYGLNAAFSQRIRTRTNPDYHPEWLKTLKAFIVAWERGEDPGTIARRMGFNRGGAA